ncbi:MAG: glycoside hydrolase family 127 protein [Clostridiales bacterium]|nr:glycoside hydrolase family 127 protein [Clostridiales bacterium]
MDCKSFSQHADINCSKINDSFWSPITELVRTQVIRYQYLALQDKIEGAEKSYCIENFIKAGKVKKALDEGKEVPTYPIDKWCYNDENTDENAFHGWVFQDSDVYKWIEAVGYSLRNHPDSVLEKQAMDFIDIICDAQLENGYLDTLYIINDRDKIFTNLKDNHELYCFGHLAEGAISFYDATNDGKLLNAACKFADLICDTFGENKIKGYPGHEIAELALVKLYRKTGKKEYLDTADFFINERGKKPYYFDIERNKITADDNYHYNQAHIQPKYQTEAVGHAVRGVYLYSAMADIAKENCDDELYTACGKIWDNIENKKLYITGGIGATVDGEAFSFDYDLPNDLAYCETCASIGLMFFARRMSEIKPDSHYADVAERALYNTVLSGMADNGKSFFYVNPLEVLPTASHLDSRKRHVKTVRQKWFSCACCPPNLARLISSLNTYIFSENEENVFIHQYIGGSLNTKCADINISSDYLNDGSVDFNIECKLPFKLALRIPEWCDNFDVNKNYALKDGYVYIDISGNDNVEIKFEILPRIVKCSNKVRENIGKAAVMRGPIVYCLEEWDNGKNLHMLKLCENPNFEYLNGCIYADGLREKEDDKLYSTYSKPEFSPCRLKFIPYYKWANRGENEMSVYIRI